MRLCPHLCAALNFISYDKRHDARPVPSDGNPIALTPIFCLSESDTFYLYPIRLTTGQNGTQGQVRVPKSNKVQHISGRSPVPIPLSLVWSASCDYVWRSAVHTSHQESWSPGDVSASKGAARCRASHHLGSSARSGLLPPHRPFEAAGR